MTLAAALHPGKVVLVRVPQAVYPSAVPALVKELLANHGNLCYVTVGRSARILFDGFQKEGLDAKAIRFIDCITKSLSVRPLATEKKMPARNAELSAQYVANPSALADLEDLLFKAVAEEKPDLVFVDSLSTLPLYNDDAAVLGFCRRLVARLRESGCKSVLLASQEDLESPPLREAAALADRVLSWP